MTIINLDRDDTAINFTGKVGYRKNIEMDAPGISDAIKIPAGLSHIAITLSKEGGGVGVVQYTISNLTRIAEDTATWIDYDGNSILSPAVTAIRLNTSVSTMFLEIRGV